METQHRKEERIDIRVTPEEKDLFIKAQRVGGYRSFSAFITSVIKEKADEIISHNEKLLASNRDRAIFFSALFADMEPNQALKEAAERYKGA